MSKLNILFHQVGLTADIPLGVVARISRTEMEASGREYFKEVVVPASSARGIDVDVEPGSYWVQAILPSGRILQQYCDVAGEETAHVSFGDDAAAAERDAGWLSWQTFDEGLIPGSSGLLRQAPTRPSFWSKIPSLETFARLIRRTILGRGDQASLSVVACPPGREAWSIVASETQDLFRQLLRRNDGDLPAEAFLEKDTGRLKLWKLKSAEQDPSQRRWALIGLGNGLELMCLPTPWRLASGEFAEVELLVDMDPERLHPRASIVVRDPDLAGLLAYLGRGNLSSVRPLVESLDLEKLVDRAISEKAANPLAACAAAYVGLAVFDLAERERWDGWLPNLMNWFPWLPDGAILHARRILLRPGINENELVLLALKRAFHAGIPFFAAGVVLLRDGLLLYAHKDQEANAMLDAVSSVASRLDQRQAFTNLRFGRGA